MKLTPWMLTVATFLIIAALVVGYLFTKLFAREEAPVIADPVRRVPMLTSPVEAGTRIERRHLGNGPWNGDLTQDTLLDRNSIIGRIAQEDIGAAVPLASSLFYPIGQVPPIELAPGTRAVAVELGNSTAMVDGLIGQGSFVDVWMTVDANVPVVDSYRRRRESLTLKLFDGIKIIGINGSLKGGRQANDSVVTMELDASQQAIMVAASNKGSITLTANPEGPGAGGLSVNMSENDRITLREVLGIEEPDVKKPFYTEVIRGQIRSYSVFDEDGNRVTPTAPGYRDTLNGAADDDISASGSPGRSNRRGGIPGRTGQVVGRSQYNAARNSSL